MIALLNSDARFLPLPDQSVHCCITSPPYWGLRSYNIEPSVWGGRPDFEHLWVEAPPPSVPKRGNKPGDYSTSSLTNPERQDRMSRGAQNGQWCQRCGAWRGCLGLEPTPELYVANLVACMREVWRVLRDDGTLWLVISDSYFGGGGGLRRSAARVDGLKPKDLVGIPWRVAFALQADGWWLRSDVIEKVELYCPCGCGYVLEEKIWRYSQDREIIWEKKNPMPESVTDRPTKSHEYVFLLAKSERYFYDQEAIKEPAQVWTGQAGTFERTGPVSAHILPGQSAAQHRPSRNGKRAFRGQGVQRNVESGKANRDERDISEVGTGPARNKRSVWTVATRPYSGAHFAVFPPDLIEPMVLAGTSARGCCPACGAPWERVVNREAMEIRRSSRTHELGRTRSSGTMIKPPSSTTSGWRPSCNCDAGDPVPCTVLDPFAGTATVGKVCAQHGRHFIGVELNPAYIELARERVSGVQMEMQA